MQQLNSKEQSVIDLTQSATNMTFNHLKETTHAYQMLTHPLHLVLPSAQWKNCNFVVITVKLTALIIFCHFKVLAYAFNASKDVTLNTDIFCSFTEDIQH